MSENEVSSSVATLIREEIVENNNINSQVITKEVPTIKVKGGKVYAFFKRAFDVFASFFAIVVGSWFLLIIAILVKLTSKGPIIYKSTRIGQNGKKFTFYKFRSMVVDAEERKKDLMDQNEIEGGIYFKMENDPRTTKFGRFIRKTSIDELPQLFNVLKGDLSLIGPRACLPEEYEKMNDYQKQRFLVPQGITGEWQVRARSNISDFDDVVKYDLDYIQNKRSFWYDIKLCFLTAWVILMGKGAE